MSWRQYHLLSAQPDFTKPPQTGVVDDRDTFAQGNAPAWMAWPDQTDRLFTFDFQTFAQAEWRTIREFFDHHAGRSKAFYLPTWSQDFAIAANATVGATEITATGHWFSDNLTSNRPDTTGRRIFTVNQAGAFEPHWIMAAEATGENDLLTLADPIQNEIEAARTMAGICHLARLTEDTIQSSHLSPDHVSTSLTFRTVNHRRRLDQIEPCASEAVGSMQPMESLVVTDADPLYPDPRVARAMGPNTYGVIQSLAFMYPWELRVDSQNEAKLYGSPSGPIDLPLYTATELPDKITMMFDAVSKEILAWEQTGQITVRWHDGGGAAEIAFEGITPVAFNTIAIDGTVTAGTATLAIFYLREGNADIFVRTRAEDFLIEHRYCASPIAAISLQAAIRDAAVVEIIGMDASHRLAKWRSEPYQTALEVQVANVGFSATEGIYIEVTQRAYPDEERGNSTFRTQITGTFAELRVRAYPDEERGNSTFRTQITGVFFENRVVALADSTKASSTFKPTMTASYTEAAKFGFPSEAATSTFDPLITGEYATP